MLSYFKSQQPVTVMVFILFFIAFKIPILLAFNILPISDIHNLWGSVGILISNSFILNFLVAQVCLFTQAIWFNYLFHKADYNEVNSMIPALYYTLVTSLIPEFNEFNMFIIIGFFLLLIFQIFLSITTKDSTKLECFNAGFFAGILIIFNLNFVIFIPFLFLIILAIKPFRFNEYLMLLFGLFFPIYIAFSISYIANIQISIKSFFIFPLSIFHFQATALNSINFTLAAGYLLFSFISLRGIMYSTGFKRRKNLNMLIFFFIGMIAIIIFSGNQDETVFSLLFIPVSIFLALLMLRIRKKRLGEILNAIFVLTILTVNIVRIFK